MSDKANTDIAAGDKVSWNWGSGNPSGKVDDVKPHDASITTHKGNEVSKKGTEDNPAVTLDLGGNKSAIKKASELTVEKEGPNHGSSKDKMSDSASNSKGEEKKGLEAPKTAKGKSKSKSPAPPAKKAEEKKKDSEEKDTKAAEEDKKEEDKPAAEDKKDDDKKDDDKKDDDEEDKPAEDNKKSNGAAKEKKKPGRKPSGGAAASSGNAKAKTTKAPKRAATESGEPRRSKRGKTE